MGLPRYADVDLNVAYAWPRRCVGCLRSESTSDVNLAYAPSRSGCIRAICLSPSQRGCVRCLRTIYGSRKSRPFSMTCEVIHVFFACREQWFKSNLFILFCVGKGRIEA